MQNVVAHKAFNQPEIQNHGLMSLGVMLQPVVARKHCNCFMRCNRKWFNLMRSHSVLSYQHAVTENWYKRGRSFFKQMQQEKRIVLAIEHYAWYIDLLGRSGNIEDAWKVNTDMPNKVSPAIWSSLGNWMRQNKNWSIDLWKNQTGLQTIHLTMRGVIRNLWLAWAREKIGIQSFRPLFLFWDQCDSSVLIKSWEKKMLLLHWLFHKLHSSP